MHFKLYQGYVKNTNTLVEKIGALSKGGQDRSSEYAGLKRMFGWEFDGMRLHEYYFENLGGSGKIDQEGALYQSLVDHFGSYEKWKQDYQATGLIRGIGWVILYKDNKTGKLFNCWINEHDLGHLSGCTPIVVMDVWEHAYITEYGLDRAAYIGSFFNNLNWKVAEERYGS